MAPPPDLNALLAEGERRILRTTAAHAQGWGFGHADRWRLDQEQGRIVWTLGPRTVSASVQVLGSWSSEAGTFVWSWDNDSIAPTLTRSARRVRELGEQHALIALHTSPLRLGEKQVRDLVAVAFEMLQGTGLYHPFDGTLATYLLFDDVLVEEGGRTQPFPADTP